jgi:hypothetical protein
VTPENPERPMLWSLLVVLAACALYAGAARSETFMEWVGSQPLERYTVFLAFGMAGMIGHYTKLWATKEINTCLWDYWVRQTPRRTVLSFMGFFSAAGAVMLAGDFPNTPWSTLIASAVTTGYTADSLLNKPGGAGRKGGADVRPE